MHVMIRWLGGVAALAVGAATVPAQAAATKPAAPHDMSKMGDGPQGGTSGWKELDAFHLLLQDAWHPVAQGNYAPAREKATALLAAARAWQRSHGKPACDTPTLRTGFADLVEHARWYHDAATRPASDDAVRVTLKATHDTFETMAEPCMMAAMKPEPKKP